MVKILGIGMILEIAGNVYEMGAEGDSVSFALSEKITYSCMFK